MLWSDSQLQTARNIVAIARKWAGFAGFVAIPEVLMLAVCDQESSFNDQAVGDAGESFGVFQIYQVAHPSTWQLALSPYADYGFSIIADSWTNAFRTLGGQGAWIGDAISFLEQFAPLAQGSNAWSHELAAQRLAEAIDIYNQVAG